MREANTVKVVAGTTIGINGITWNVMYNKQKSFIENSNGINSYGGMITGAAFDQVMLFVNEKTKYINGTTADGTYNINAKNQVAHNLSHPYETGNTNYTGEEDTYKDMVCNIYDLEGNELEWTTEANNTVYRNFRGGCYNNALSVSYRYYYQPTGAGPTVGSRAVLFVKSDNEEAYKIHFTIDNVEYAARRGSTWGDWIADTVETLSEEKRPYI